VKKTLVDIDPEAGLTQGCQIFFVPLTKTVKIFRMTIKYTKWSQNIQNGSKIDEMAIKCTNIFHRSTLKKFTKIGILGLKIYHLATLVLLL
jgi:hypothetical protein